MHDDKVEIFRSFEKPNAQLQIEQYKRTYGNLNKEEILANIEQSDSYTELSLDDRRYMEIEKYVTDMRIWFVCLEWLEFGPYGEHSCVYYQRKFQYSKDIEKRCLDLAKEFNGQVYGYPTRGEDWKYILVPDEKTKESLDKMIEKAKLSIGQWGYLPPLLSDVRLWPYKYRLPVDNTVTPTTTHPWNCLPGEW